MFGIKETNRAGDNFPNYKKVSRFVALLNNIRFIFIYQNLFAFVSRTGFVSKLMF